MARRKQKGETFKTGLSDLDPVKEVVTHTDSSEPVTVELARCDHIVWTQTEIEVTQTEFLLRKSGKINGKTVKTWTDYSWEVLVEGRTNMVQKFNLYYEASDFFVKNLIGEGKLPNRKRSIPSPKEKETHSTLSRRLPKMNSGSEFYLKWKGETIPLKIAKISGGEMTCCLTPIFDPRIEDATVILEKRWLETVDLGKRIVTLWRHGNWKPVFTEKLDALVETYQGLKSSEDS